MSEPPSQNSSAIIDIDNGKVFGDIDLDKIADKDNSLDRDFNSDLSIWFFVVVLVGLSILLVVLCKRIRDQRLNGRVPEHEMTKTYREKRKAISREIFKSFDRQKELHR